jgi:hypothetical protein
MRTLLCLAPLLLVMACTTTTHVEEVGGSSSDIAFHAEAPVLPDFAFDTGLQPSSGPAQVQLKLTSAGSIVVDAAGTKAGDKVQGKPGAGKLKLDMHVKFDGTLKVDAGVKKYEGPFPGLKDVDVPIAGDVPFDGFVLDGDPAQVAANLPETKLPDIPLGSVPGHLSLTVVAGSQVTTSFHGSCVEIKGGQATLHGRTVTSGKLVLKAQVVLDIPLYNKAIDLPQISVDLPKSDKALDSGAAAAAGVADATCGATAPSGDPPQGPASGGADGGTTTDASPPATDAGPPSGDNTCGAASTKDDCISCCAANHNAGASVYVALYDDCACGAGGQCKTQCASTYCSDPQQTSPDCDTCLNGSTCKDTARSACAQGGGDCAAFLGCVDGQACKAKP